MTSTPRIAASIICADLGNLSAEVQRVEAGGADWIHFDVMDGVFVPRYGLPPEMLQTIRTQSTLPVDVHLMVSNPEPYLPTFAQAGATVIAVHAEACPHLHRTITHIKKTGVEAGVALNPATPLSILDYVLDDISLVVLMAINPGIVGHQLIPGMFDKITQLKEKIGNRAIAIEIDGGVTFDSAPQMIARGATMLVCGTGTIFRPHEAPVDQKIREFRATIQPEPALAAAN
jgi:ribulose-phosphate 3-epimerase